MKKHIILWMLMTILVNVLHSQTIGTAEYFFDTDPGIGNGFPFTMSITADSANSSQTVSVSALSVGFHRLYIRVKQSDGNWSLTDEELFYIYPTTATTITPLNQAQIKSGEYFFDTDPGVGNGTQINGFTVGDSIDYTSSISVGSLSIGFHRFYVRTKNATGNWSLPDEELIYIYSTTTPGSNPQPSQIQKLEYFLDNVDPGPGNGIAITNFSVSDSIQILDSLNVTALSAGVHKINVRTKDLSGNWSLSSVKEFSVLPCVLPVPNFSFTDVCLGDSIQLINTSTSLNSPTFSWDIMNDGSIENTSSSGFKYSINQAGSFQVKLKVTNQSLCSDSIIKTIIVHDLPNALASAIGNPVFCDGLSVVLTGNTGPSFAYQWQKDSVNITGATNLFYTANAAGYYRFKLTDSYGCSNVSNNVQVIVNSVPTASINPINGTNFCQGDSLSFSAPTGTGYSYQWKLNGVAIPQAILNTVWIKQSGVLTVEITNANGCVSTSAATTVIMNYPPFAALLPLGSTTFCEGDSVGLGTTNGSAYTYQWYKNSNLINGANQSIYYAKESGDFYAKVTNANGCSSNSSLQSVVVNPMPIANFITLPEICQTDTALINFTGTSYGNALFNWNFDGGTILSGSGSGPYQIKYNSGGNKIIQLQLVENACMSSTKKDSIQVKSFAVTLSSISNPEICQGDSMILYVNSSNSFLYSWYKNNTLITGVNSASYTSADAGNYTVFVKDTVGGCSATSNVLNLVVNSGDFNIDFTATPTTLTSPPFNVQFNNNTPNYTNYFFEWSFDDGTSSTYFNPLHNYPYNGTYSVRLIAENQTTGCKDTLVKSNYIQCSGGQNNPCTITAGIISTGASLICAGDSSKLEANSGAGLSYQWTHNNVVIAGANQSVYYAKAVGVYRVIVSNSICSVVSNSFILSHYPGINPVIVASGSITPCTNDSMQLLLLNNYNSYHWSTSDTTASIWVNQTGYYTVTVTNNYNCNLVSNPYSVSTSFLIPPTICLVGVDTNNHNRIIWERPNTQLIDSFYVYREGFVANDYEKIGSVAYSAPGIFSDTNSNPQVRAYRYKMAALDTCGQMTLLGDYHKSIHLTINAGLNGTWNLIWDGYIGFPFGSYRIYRGTTANNLSLLTQIQSSLNSYSDINPPGGNVFYQIEVMKNSGCYPDSNFAKVNTNYNSSRSNTANNTQATPPQMNAEFSSDKTWGFLPAKIKFTDESSGYPSSWLWDFGDGQTSAQQNPEHTYTTQGIYDVTLTITNIFGNHTTTKTAFIYIITNGLGDQQSDFNLAIYPNPNNGLFTLLMNSDHKFNAQLEIVNSIGQIVYSDNVEFKTGDVRKELSLDNLDKGFYFVIIKSEKEKIVRKLLIQ